MTALATPIASRPVAACSTTVCIVRQRVLQPLRRGSADTFSWAGAWVEFVSKALVAKPIDIPLEMRISSQSALQDN